MKQVYGTPSLFLFQRLKKIAQKKKNEHGDICFLINYKLLCKISFKITSFLFMLLHCVTFFILDLNVFLALIVFYIKNLCLKNKLRAFFRCVFVFFY